MIQAVYATDVPSYHAKRLLARSRDRRFLLFLDGSANVSSRGMGGTTTSKTGAPEAPSSHETGILLCLPIHSESACHLIGESDAFSHFLATSGRLLPSDAATAALVCSDEVRKAKAKVKEARRAGKVGSAEKALAGIREKHWSICSQVRPPFTTHPRTLTDANVPRQAAASTALARWAISRIDADARTYNERERYGIDCHIRSEQGSEDDLHDVERVR